MPTEDIQSQTKSNQSEASRAEFKGKSATNPSIVDVKRVLFKRRYLILSVVAVALIISVIYAKTRVPLYEASALAEIDTSRSSSLSLGGALGGDLGNNSTELQTDVVRLTGDSLLFRAVGELALQNKGPFPNAFKGVSLPITDDSLPTQQRLRIIGVVKSGIAVSILPRTTAVRISFRYPNPVVARDVVNNLLTVFMDRSVEDRLYATQQAAQMLSPQMEELKAHAADAQRALAKYQAEHNFIGEESSQDSSVNLTVDQLRAVNQQLADAQADLIIKKARLQLVQSTPPESLLSVAPTPTLSALRGQLDNAKARLGELKTKYGSGYPAVHQLEIQIPELEKEITAEANNVKRRVQEEYETSSGTVRSIQQRLDEEMQQAYKNNEGAAEYAILREDAESSGDLYNALQLKLKESSVTAALDAASISVIDRAVVKPAPVEPNSRRIVMTGGLGGILFAVFLALGLEALDDTIETSEDLENSSKLYSLGAIPHFEVAPLVKEDLATGEVKLPSRLISISAKDSLAAESFRVIRSAILLSSVDAPKKCLLVTSSFMAEGKSTLSSNLAVALAQRGARVLLVDTDLRRSTLSAMFQLSGSLPGLSNILGRLEEGSPYLTPIESLPTLTFLPAGIKVPNPAELLASSRMSSLIAQWREEYDHVVLDSAPVLMVSDSLPIAAQADGVVLVVRSGSTRKTALARSYELLTRSSANILGAVVNDVDLRLENYYTYSNKGYGYGYSGYSRYKSYSSPYSKPYGDDRKDGE